MKRKQLLGDDGLVAAARRKLRRVLLALCTSFASAAAALPPHTPEEASDARLVLAEARERLAGVEARFQNQLCLCPRGAPGISRPVRIFIDGVFDLMHFGHMNAFRQARALGGWLVVGVNSDESVAIAKGLLPVLKDEVIQHTMRSGRPQWQPVVSSTRWCLRRPMS
ncbi:unnamed protein product, partial [Polarella glacialis]